ncbi:MAG: hypothetical protein WCE61_20975 [Candidatus Acidiferrum sp.]
MNCLAARDNHRVADYPHKIVKVEQDQSLFTEVWCASGVLSDRLRSG